MHNMRRRHVFDGCIHGGNTDPCICPGFGPAGSKPQRLPLSYQRLETRAARREILRAMVKTGISTLCCDPASSHSATRPPRLVKQGDLMARCS